MKTLVGDRWLAENFRTREFLVSKDQPKLARLLRPSFYHLSNLHMLCATILQPVRTRFRVQVIVLSGYRDHCLNDVTGGHEESLHLQAKAADITTPDVTMLPDMFEHIREELPFAWSQLIYYADRNFIHVGLPHLDAPMICEVRGKNGVQPFGG